VRAEVFKALVDFNIRLAFNVGCFELMHCVEFV
jgi:hypothetical protein